MYALNIHVHLDDPTSLARVLSTLEDTDAHIDITTIDDDADRTQAILAAALASRDASLTDNSISTDHDAPFGGEGYVEADQTPPLGTERPEREGEDDYDEICDRLDDLESRFRGLLADFEGSCTQINTLQREVLSINDRMADHDERHQRPVVHYRYSHTKGAAECKVLDHEWTLTYRSPEGLRRHRCLRCGLSRQEVASS